MYSYVALEWISSFCYTRKKVTLDFIRRWDWCDWCDLYLYIRIILKSNLKSYKWYFRFTGDANEKSLCVSPLSLLSFIRRCNFFLFAFHLQWDSPEGFEIPWITQIYITKSKSPICLGSLIHPNIVMTTLQCVSS